MRTKKQELTSIRNWSKGRLIGFKLDERVLTKEEKILHGKLREAAIDLLNSWDKQSKVFSKILDKKIKSDGQKRNTKEKG